MIGDTANSEVVGKHGEKVTVDVGIAEAKPEDYDALLIPGGFSPDHLRGDTEGRYGTFAKYFTKMMYQHLPFVMGHKYYRRFKRSYVNSSIERAQRFIKCRRTCS